MQYSVVTADQGCSTEIVKHNLDDSGTQHHEKLERHLIKSHGKEQALTRPLS